MPLKKKLRTPRSVVRVGDLVAIKFGTSDVKGRVVEDRGGLGVKGRNLYRIALQIVGGPMSIEMPADEIRIIRRATPSKKSPRAIGSVLKKPRTRSLPKKAANSV